MRGLFALVAATLALAVALAPRTAPAEAEEPHPVVVVEIEGEISEGMPNAVRRAVSRAEDSGASQLVVDIQTFGGRVSSAAAIRDALLDAEVPVVALVDNRAISAGALIALASDHIFMTPGGSIGAATPYRQEGDSPEVDEKMVSAMRSMFRATAETRGHPVELAEAMVDANVSIEGVSEEGKLLTLTSEEATELGLAEAVVSSLDALVAENHIGSGEQVQITLSPAERLADFLSRPAVAGLLLSIGIWALIFSFKIPGTGVPELVALLAIGAFLFGKHVAGIAGLEDMVLVGVGAALLAIEIFVIPGMGIAGILGVLAMGTGLVMAAIGHTPTSPFFWDELTRAITMLGLAVGLGIAWSVLAYWALRKTDMWQRFTLRGSGLAPPAADTEEQNRRLGALKGSTGTAKTALRPEGEVEVGGQTYSARAERGYLDSQSAVAVVSHDGRRLVVRHAESDTGAEDGAGSENKDSSAPPESGGGHPGS